MIIPLPAQIGAAAVGSLLAGWLLVSAVLKAVEKGEDLSNARWEAEIARLNDAHEVALGKARDAGRAEMDNARRDAEKRAEGALKALDEARNADPDFDKALRARWPDAWFVSVCGKRPGCIPEN